MPRRFFVNARTKGKAAFILALMGLLAPRMTLAWGESAQRMVVNHAVDTLPYEIRPFFENNRKFLMDHVDDPLGLIDEHPWERNNHFIELDKYGKFPFSALPRSYKVIKRIARVALSPDVLDDSATLPPQDLGPAQAIHLASALAVKRDLTAFVSYDEPLLAAARDAGLPVGAVHRCAFRPSHHPRIRRSVAPPGGATRAPVLARPPSPRV